MWFLNPFSAHKYDPKTVKVEIPNFENISFYDYKEILDNTQNLLRMKEQLLQILKAEIVYFSLP